MTALYSWRAERRQAQRELDAAFPSLCTPVGQRILHHFVQRYGTEARAQMETMSDAEFLERRNFGPRMLALLRTVVPAPLVPAPVPPARIAVIRDITDPWAEHAALVELGCLEAV